MLSEAPVIGCNVKPKMSDILHWEGTITGPKGTPYEGGIFQIELNFDTGYPLNPPKVSVF
ncbi:hypothetical protein FBUS_11793 [Fasciolopsis buskii]|uniref:UBC core domain-containing protein n=1 Tax=Fasciolopsis buskii TaxID=27845 RepID=A0A8E0VIY4_9TREM|nr:hypothetical protein FBUS_11793 [Fasciolopsis buski]